MNDNNNDSKLQRENLRQKEMKRNPLGNLSDGFNRSQSGNLSDLVGGSGWKSTGMIIILIIIIFVIYQWFSNS